MKKLLLFSLACAIGLAISACTATDRAQMDRPASIVCHDYAGVIFNGRSVGKPQRSDTGEGMWEFVNATNGKFTQIEGNCVVAYDS
jgi:hypothetical protein